MDFLNRNRIFSTLLLLSINFCQFSCRENTNSESIKKEITIKIPQKNKQYSAELALSTTLLSELIAFVDKNPIKPKSDQIYLIWFWENKKDTLVRLERSLKPNIYKGYGDFEKDLKVYKGGFYYKNKPVLIIDEGNLFGSQFYDISKLDKSMSEKFNQKEDFKHSDVYDNVLNKYKIVNGDIVLDNTNNR